MPSIAELQIRAFVELEALLYETYSYNIPTQELYVKYPLWDFYTFKGEPCRIIHLGIIDDVPIAEVVFPAYEHQKQLIIEHYVRADRLKRIKEWTKEQTELLNMCKMPGVFTHPLGVIKYKYPKVLELIKGKKDIPLKKLSLPTHLHEIETINHKVQHTRAPPPVPIINPSDTAQLELYKNICTKTLYKDLLNEDHECQCKVKH